MPRKLPPSIICNWVRCGYLEQRFVCHWDVKLSPAKKTPGEGQSLLQCRKNLSLQNAWLQIPKVTNLLVSVSTERHGLSFLHPYLWSPSTTWIFCQFHPSPPSITTPMKSFQFSLIALASPAPLLPWSACNCRWFSVCNLTTESSTLAQNDSAWFSSFGWFWMINWQTVRLLRSPVTVNANWGASHGRMIPLGIPSASSEMCMIATQIKAAMAWPYWKKE